MLGEEDQRGEPPAERTPSREEVLSNLAAARNRFERQRGETQSPEMRQALDDGLDAIARFEDVLDRVEGRIITSNAELLEALRGPSR